MLNVGDRVRFKTWEQMLSQYGLNTHGSIDCLYSFTDDMMHLCGTCATVESISGSTIFLTDFEASGHNCFVYSEDMLERVDENEQTEFKVGDIVVGNERANNYYGITKQGWVGIVTRVDGSSSFVAEGLNNTRDDRAGAFDLDKICFNKGKHYENIRK